MAQDGIMTEVAKEMGWFDRIKEGLKFDAISQKIGLSEYSLVGLFISVAVGFAVGFLWKRYARYLLITFLFIGIVILLQNLQLIQVYISWEKIHELTGVSVPVGQEAITTVWWLWIKQNILLSVGFFIGFLLGVKFN